MSDAPQGFAAMRERLDAISSKVSDGDTSLDEALLLFEEAVNIGLLACEEAEISTISDDDAQEIVAGDGATGADATDSAALDADAKLGSATSDIEPA